MCGGRVSTGSGTELYSAGNEAIIRDHAYLVWISPLFIWETKRTKVKFCLKSWLHGASYRFFLFFAFSVFLFFRLLVFAFSFSVISLFDF